MNEPRSTYAPNLIFPFGEPMYPPSSWTASVYEPYAEMGEPYMFIDGVPMVISGPAPYSPAHDLWSTLQDAGHAIEHGLHDLPNLGHTITQAIDQPSQILQTAAKANQASDALTQTSEDAKRALAAAEETAKAVKYIAFGLGGLAAIALVVHIVKTAT